MVDIIMPIGKVHYTEIVKEVIMLEAHLYYVNYKINKKL
jgi:hypothetical protein